MKPVEELRDQDITTAINNMTQVNLLLSPGEAARSAIEILGLVLMPRETTETILDAIEDGSVKHQEYWDGKTNYEFAVRQFQAQLEGKSDD